MNFVKQKVTNVKSKHTVANFEAVKQPFLDEVVTSVAVDDIPPELVLNWDQTEEKIVPSSSWTVNQCDVNQVDMIGMNYKWQTTALFCGTLVGDCLPI